MAIFDLDDPQKTIKNRSGLREVIATQLAGSGRFRVVPADRVKAALAAKKKQSYDSCYAESCQIEIGNELAASHTLVGSIQRFDEDCILTLTLYSLREAASVGGAQAKGLCKASTLADLAQTVAQRLARGDKAPTAADPAPPPPQQTTDYAALAAEAEAGQREADRAREAKVRAEEVTRERARAERLDRLEVAWTSVARVAATEALDKSRRAKVIEQFLKDFNTDNPREGEARELLTALQAGKEPNAARGGMVRVPGGPFFMGCNLKVDNECYDNEKPSKTVQVATFQIDQTEVTMGAYAGCVKAGGCTAPNTGGSCNWGQSGRSNHPVNCVDWNQAAAYCKWAKKRLPTEAEWEKAARGVNGLKYPWGDDFDPVKANTRGSADGFETTSPVDEFQGFGGPDIIWIQDGASPYGALDMAGNVAEWVADWRKAGVSRSIRGGSWNHEPRLARASHRSSGEPGARSADLGFRCAQND